MTDAPGTDVWKENTSAFDRVRSITVTLSQPRTADWIAEEAQAAGNTARDHLQRLVDMNVLQTVSGEQATLYQPDPLYTRMRALVTCWMTAIAMISSSCVLTSKSKSNHGNMSTMSTPQIDCVNWLPR